MEKIAKILMTPWFFRRLAMIWACWLATVIVFKTFGTLSLIDGARATLLATFFGVLSTIVLFYHRDRQADAQIETEDEAVPEVVIPETSVVQSNEPDDIT